VWLLGASTWLGREHEHDHWCPSHDVPMVVAVSGRWS
jgi:hypothetical protein